MSEVQDVCNCSEVDKIHVKFCSNLLSVKKQTSNFAVYRGLRFPLSRRTQASSEIHIIYNQIQNVCQPGKIAIISSIKVSVITCIVLIKVARHDTDMTGGQGT